MADRRQRVRFEIFGRLQGTIVTRQGVRVENISAGGALIDAPWSLPVDTVQTVYLDSASQQSTLQARVCHSRPTFTNNRYLIGLEFLEPDPTAAAHLAQLAVQSDSVDFSA